MTRVLAACAVTTVLTLSLTIALTAQRGALRVAASAQAQAFVPPCPQASYGADGNMGPLFCVVDNPTALHNYAPLAKHTFALGPNATPGQVVAALVADYKHGGTEPIRCSIYRLTAWRNHWRFGISGAAAVGAELNFPSGWCSEPSFSSIE